MHKHCKIQCQNVWLTMSFQFCHKSFTYTHTHTHINGEAQKQDTTGAGSHWVRSSLSPVFILSLLNVLVSLSSLPLSFICKALLYLDSAYIYRFLSFLFLLLYLLFRTYAPYTVQHFWDYRCWQILLHFAGMPFLPSLYLQMLPSQIQGPFSRTIFSRTILWFSQQEAICSFPQNWIFTVLYLVLNVHDLFPC